MKHLNLKSTLWYLLLFSFLCPPLSLAQPTWQVNPSDFQYSMTITGVGLFQCQETQKSANMVAAFINGECRGVQAFDTEYQGRQFAFLSIHNNAPSGDRVTLRYYDADQNEILDGVNTLTFVDNNILGSLEAPYLFKTNYEVSELSLSTLVVYDYNIKDELVAEIQATNENNEPAEGQVSFLDDELGPDNDFFSIQGNQLLLAQDVNFPAKTSYQVHLQFTTAEGCQRGQAFTLEVVNTNEAPVGIDPSMVSIPENEAPGSVVSPLTAIDDTPNEIHQFQLIGSAANWPDNTFFEINGSTLVSTVTFDYEDRNAYQIQVLITDRVQNTYVDTIDISVLDVIEFGDLKAGNLVTPNSDGFNDTFTIPNAELYQDYELCIYNGNGNLVFSQSGNYNNDWGGQDKNGKLLPNGTYYFVLTDRNNDNNRFAGDLHLYQSRNY